VTQGTHDKKKKKKKKKKDNRRRRMASSLLLVAFLRFLSRALLLHDIAMESSRDDFQSDVFLKTPDRTERPIKAARRFPKRNALLHFAERSRRGDQKIAGDGLRPMVLRANLADQAVSAPTDAVNVAGMARLNSC
jgi:hypothetical protein